MNEPKHEKSQASIDLAVEINRLFELVRKSAVECHGCRGDHESASVPMSRAYLLLLRSGSRSHPTVQCVPAIAQFLGVPSSYLLDADLNRSIDAQSALLQAMKGGRARSLALRASRLAPRALAGIAAVGDRARGLENSPPAGPEDR